VSCLVSCLESCLESCQGSPPWSATAEFAPGLLQVSLSAPQVYPSLSGRIHWIRTNPLSWVVLPWPRLWVAKVVGLDWRCREFASCYPPRPVQTGPTETSSHQRRTDAQGMHEGSPPPN